MEKNLSYETDIKVDNKNCNLSSKNFFLFLKKKVGKNKKLEFLQVVQTLFKVRIKVSKLFFISLKTKE